MDDACTNSVTVTTTIATAAAIATTAAATAPPCRVVVHLDLDCFYAQVEQRRLQIPADEPIAVQQWGTLLAVNYIARRFGVLRGDYVSDALKKCPNIHLPHVDTLGENRRPNEAFDRKHQKAILWRYRLASREIFDVLRRHAPLCEKAGIDEAFLDLTEQARQRLAQMDAVSSDFCADPANAATKVFGVSQMDGLVKDVELEPLAGFPLTEQEQLLAVGAVIATEIRDAIRKELQFTCSTGIATNKLLAKIASPLNKPDGQTLIAPRFVSLLLQHFPLRKVRGLGGKLGKELESLLRQHEAPAPSVAPSAATAKATATPAPAPTETAIMAAAAPAAPTAENESVSSKITVAEFVETVRFDALVKHLGYDTAAFVRQVCAGEDGDDPVNDKKTEIKTLSSVKQFDQRTGDALARIEQLAYWVRVLCEEIILRLEDERVESRRFPLRLSVTTTRVREKPRARKLRIAQTTTVDDLFTATMAVLQRDLSNIFPCAALSMHAKDFIALDSASTSSISSFFTKQQLPDAAEPETSAMDNTGDTVAADAVAAVEPREHKQIGNTVQRRTDASSKKRATISAFFHATAPVATVAAECEASTASTTSDAVVERSAVSVSTSDLDVAVLTSETAERAPARAPLHKDAFAQFRSSGSSARDASFYCERCLRHIAEPRAEHVDFHFAVDLSRGENCVQSTAAPARSSATGAGSNSKKRKATGPLDAFLKR